MSMGMLARQGAQQGYDYRHLHHYHHAGRQLHGAQPLPCPAPQQLQQRRAQAEERGEEERFQTF